MTGQEGGQQAAETCPSEADPDPPAPAATQPVPPDEQPSAGEQPAAGERLPAEAPPAPGQPVQSPEVAPAPQQRPAPAYEPAPAGPFRGATPALGSAWLGAPGTVPGPAGIEATTGAPITMLPQRAPRALPTWHGPTGSLPTIHPGADPETVEEEEEFWLPIEEVHWDGTPVQPTPRTWYGRPKDPAATAARQRAPRPPKPQRNPALGLAGVILCSLVASFFAWVSAEPFWLAVGHGERGTATVETCTGRGLAQHCRGDFRTDSGLFRVHDVRLVGVDGQYRDFGNRLAARMTGAESGKAYVGVGTGLLHLRWVLGFAMLLLCCLGAGWATGALRLPDRRNRHAAALVSVAGPVLLTAGFLAAAY
ncbi:hypothetical protein [Plantactinospora endophytica]|uniref:Uncharacterized protein n=1 Tax=Plantactinospora endophytica TaxID=673535 RepID=A0ABQ4DT27_9ACTN|nr:hypothetical protein [Plantactinospora endophytica]GIG85611.1 hypothetical protein Pen02_05470 [Plantactinospora endophytica]